MKKYLLIVLAAMGLAACKAVPEQDFGPEVEQVSIPRVELMAAMPQPYKILDWHQKALDFDAYAYDFNTTLPAGPVIWMDGAGRNLSLIHI